MMWLRAEGICRLICLATAARTQLAVHHHRTHSQHRLKGASPPFQREREREREGGEGEREGRALAHTQVCCGSLSFPPAPPPHAAGCGHPEPPQARHTHGPQPGTPARPAPGEHSEDVSEHRVTDLQLCPSRREKRRAEWRVERPCARGGEGPPRAGPAWGAPGEQPRPERRLFRSGPQGARLSADSARALEPVCSVCSEGGIRQP